MEESNKEQQKEIEAKRMHEEYENWESTVLSIGLLTAVVLTVIITLLIKIF